MKKIILLLLCSLLSVPSVFAETLFYKANGEPIQNEEHAQLYRIMLENQFPSSVVFGSYQENEQKAMQEQIARKLPASNITCSFIPTTLYHLFCLKFMHDNYDIIEQASSGILAKYKHPYCNLTSNIPWNDIGADFENVNTRPDMIAFHGSINNYILDTLRTHNLTTPQTLEDSLKIIDTIDFYLEQNLALKKFYNTIRIRINTLIAPKLIKDVIATEYKALASNKFLLYRGTKTVDHSVPKFHLKELKQGHVVTRSLSFGSSLHGGIVFDPTACALYYMSNYIGYALMIDKKDYMLGLLGNMFFIPPLISLLDLIGYGEYFHARTKIIDTAYKLGFVFINYPNLEWYKLFVFRYEIAAGMPERAKEIYQNMLHYIEKNHIILKQSLSAKL